MAVQENDAKYSFSTLGLQKIRWCHIYPSPHGFLQTPMIFLVLVSAPGYQVVPSTKMSLKFAVESKLPIHAQPIV